MIEPSQPADASTHPLGSAHDATHDAAEQDLDRMLHEVDRRALAEDFGRYNQLFWRTGMIPETFLAELLAEVEQLRPRVVRKTVPGYKKSGSVSYYDILEAAPRIRALYENRALIALFSEIAGVPLHTCPDDDPHAAALYHYTEAGDGVGFHYDKSYYTGPRYTVLLGLVNRTEKARLVVRPYVQSSGADLELQLSTEPGMLIFFNGNNIYHSVTPVAEGDERVVLTFEYVTSRSMSPMSKLISNLKDAMTYFGFKRLLAPRRARAA